MNAPGAQPTAVGLSTAASSPIGVGSLSFRWTARRLIGGAIAAAIILLPIAGVVWHASNMQQATAPAAPSQNTVQEEGSYRAARGNLDLLKGYVQSCHVCAFKADASNEIQQLERSRRAQDEERRYRTARGNAGLLNTYVQSCTVCAFKMEATNEAQQIEKDQRARDEEGRYRTASGDLDALKRYVRDCIICAFASPARTEISRLEEVAKYVTFRVCNTTSYRIAIAASGRRNPASGDYSIEGWWDIAPGACGALGRFAKGSVYAVARVRGDSMGWRGSDIKLCVEFPGPFDRVAHAYYSCRANERLESFRKFSVIENFTWTVAEGPTESEEFFTFSVCNKSSRWAAVAISGRERPESSDWIVQGWTRVGPGQCQDVGKYVRGIFYAFAQVLNRPDSGWKGSDLWLCVQYPGPFKRINRGGETCGNNELQPFRKFYVSSARQVWNLGQ
jgi:uncharacterized membrane protein